MKVNIKIKDLPKCERPRERLIHYGVEALSNKELLAVLLKNGTKENSAKMVALLLLKQYGTIDQLKKANYHQLVQIPGIGCAKACELLAMIELGKRMCMSDSVKDSHKITNASLVYQYYSDMLKDKKQELFCCLYLDQSKKIIDSKKLFQGTLNQSLVHPREIFKEAYLLSASSIICVHNHPSGNSLPSREDIELTQKLCTVGSFCGIPIIDHVIIGQNEYYSFLENNQLPHERIL